MYAWVAFSDGKKAIVPTSSIRSFNPSAYEKKKKYNVLWEEDGNYYDGVVLAVNETRMGIEEETKKRASVPNFHYCDSASDLSDIDKAPTTSFVMQPGASSIETIAKKKIAEVTERRNIQTKLNEKLKTTTDKPLSSASGGCCTANSNTGIKRSILQGDVGPEAKKKMIMKKQTNIDIPGTDKKKGAKSDMSTKKEVPKIVSVADVKQRYVVKDDQTKKNSVETVQVEVHKTSVVIENHDKHEIKTNSKMIDKGGPSGKDQLGGSFSDVDISSETYKSVMEELKRSKAENLALKKKCTAYEKSIAKQRVEIESLHELNTDALKISLDMQKEVVKKMEGFSAFMEYFLDDKRFKNMSIVTKRTHIIRTGSYIGQYIADLKKGHIKRNKDTKNDIGDDTRGLALSFELDPPGSGQEETAEIEDSNEHQDIDSGDYGEDAPYLNIKAVQYMETIEDEEKIDSDASVEEGIEEYNYIGDKLEPGEEEENEM